MRLLRSVWRDQLTFPISRAGLVLARVGSLEGQLDVLDRAEQDPRRSRSSVRCCTSGAVDSTSARRERGVVGPAAERRGCTRAPQSVLRELIATAERSLLFTRQSICGAMSACCGRCTRHMRGRALNVRVVLAADKSATDTHLAARRCSALVPREWA